MVRPAAASFSDPAGARASDRGAVERDDRKQEHPIPSDGRPAATPARACYICGDWKPRRVFRSFHEKPGGILICCACAKWLGLWNGFGTCPRCLVRLCPQHDAGHICNIENIQDGGDAARGR